MSNEGIRGHIAGQHFFSFRRLYTARRKMEKEKKDCNTAHAVHDIKEVGLAERNIQQKWAAV
jgi:hypothetical protein